jgi:hypothetical protein
MIFFDIFEGIHTKRAVFQKCFLSFLESSILYCLIVNLTSNKFTMLLYLADFLNIT